MISAKGSPVQQSSLFDGADSNHGLALPQVGIVGSSKALNKAQRLFNRMVIKLEKQAREIEEWQQYLAQHQQRVVSEFQPLQLQMRDQRVAFVRLLDSHMENRHLTRTQREKLRDVLTQMLEDLLTGAESDELIALYDKYNTVEYREAQAFEMDMLRSMTGSMFGVDLDDGTPSAELSVEQLSERLRAALNERARESPPRSRKKSAKTLAHEAAQAAATQDATQAVRAVYRKLASELHPDREADPQRQAQLTELMKQANGAYQNNDLLALLRMQLQIEQLNPQALTELAEARLAGYNHALQAQSDKLAQQLRELTAPFFMLRVTKLTPEAVSRRFSHDIQALQDELRMMTDDLEKLRDVRAVKQWLKGFRRERIDDPDFEALLRTFDQE